MMKCFQVDVPTNETQLTSLIGDVGRGTAILLQAPSANAATIYFGNRGALFGLLEAGKSISLPLTKYDSLYFRGTTGDDLNVVIVK